MVFGRAEQPNLTAFGGIAFGQCGKMARRPAFGRAVLCAGAEGGDWPGVVQTVRLHGGGAGVGGNGEAREIAGARLERHAFRVGQGCVTINHQRQRGLIQLADVVEQRVAALAHIAGALRDAAGAGNQRGFKRAGQHDYLVVAAPRQLFAQPPALAQLQCAVGEGVFQNPVDFRHALEHGHRPLGREYIDPAAGVQFVQAAVERLRHHTVADPRGGDDEDVFGHGGEEGAGCRFPYV